MRLQAALRLGSEPSDGAMNTNREREGRPQSIVSGVISGIGSMVTGVSIGVAGLVTAPVAGSMAGGARGGCLGLGVGATVLVGGVAGGALTAVENIVTGTLNTPATERALLLLKPSHSAPHTALH